MKKLIFSFIIIIGLYNGIYYQSAIAQIICPVADFTVSPDTHGCHPFTVSFANLSTDACCYVWDFGDVSPVDTAANPTHTFFNFFTTIDTIYCVTLIAVSSDSCKDTITKCIVVHPKPVITSFTYTSIGCAPLYNALCVSTSGADTLFWDFGDSTNTTSLVDSCIVHLYINDTADPVFYYPMIIAGNVYGCSDTATDSVIVLPEVTAAFSSLPDTAGCHPFMVDFVNFSTNAIVGYKWDFSYDYFSFNIESTDSTPSHTFTNPSCFGDTIYTVTLIATGFPICRDTATQYILVHPKPVADFAVDVDTGCSCFTVTITNLSTCYDSLFWDFGDGIDTVAAGTFTHTYCNTTDSVIIYTLRSIAKNSVGCADTLVHSIVVYPSFTANFITLPDTHGCHPFTVCFLNLSVGANIYSWDFGDGDTSTLENPCHTFTNPVCSDTVYTVELITTSVFGCGSDTVSHTILIHPKPVANFTVSADTGCSPLMVTINNLSSCYDTLCWDFGDGVFICDTSTTITHWYINTTSFPTTYLLRLIAINQYNCVDTFIIPITVYPEIIADFIQTPDTAGCHPFTVSFSNLSAGADTCLWDFGDGSQSTLNNPTHTFYNTSATTDTIFTVQLICSSAVCPSDTAWQDILVKPKPFAAFTLSDTSGCGCLTVSINNVSIGADSFFWDFGDFSTDTTPAPSFTHTYCNLTPTPVTYLLTLIISNLYGCADTISQSITVFPEVTAAFAINMDSVFTVNFIDSSQNAVSYYWNFGDGNTDTVANTQHTYAFADSVYVACLTVTNACGKDSTICDSITIICPAPVAKFSYVDSGLTVNFSDSSTGAANWLWDFGDGIGTSTAKDTTYTYASAGAYWVTLTVTNPCGSDTTTRLVAVDVLGINEIWLSYKIKLYPNPNDGNFQIDYQLSEGEKGNFTIFDIMGKMLLSYNLVSEKNTLKISESALNNGLYFYKIIIDNNVVITDKLLIIK